MTQPAIGAIVNDIKSFTTDSGREYMKICCNCGYQMKDEKIFCPLCGTKQYRKGNLPAPTGQLLVRIRNCTFYRAGIIPFKCTLQVYDNHIDVVDDREHYFLHVMLQQVEKLESHDNRIQFNLVQNKKASVTLLPIYTGFIPYLFEMITDWKSQTA